MPTQSDLRHMIFCFSVVPLHQYIIQCFSHNLLQTYYKHNTTQHCIYIISFSAILASSAYTFFSTLLPKLVFSFLSSPFFPLHTLPHLQFLSTKYITNTCFLLFLSQSFQLFMLPPHHIIIGN